MPGGVVGTSSNQTVIDSIIVSNTLIETTESHSSAGAGIGSMSGCSTLRNFHAPNAIVKVFKPFSAAGGVVIGVMDKNTVAHSATVTYTLIEAMDSNSWAAAGSGHMKGMPILTPLTP
ncbi:MAG: hypothetical protein QS748_00245 [Candidatus Endonucleobacter bathymodioli]|uniref:Uncharacterized protein n=1 Tax=Candidatus Endonucleibacter bathymodioli TaxID=539814 RepID=A0AA90SC76_9GAMM|nr:hypothetical protein [Candidatus Endonucleobacter bathymodioli]